MNKLKDKIKDRFTVENFLIFLCCFVILTLTYFVFTKGNLWFHSDSAAVVNMARECIRTGEFYPKNWYGATGLFTGQILLSFIMRIVPDYIVAHNIYQLYWVVLMILSAYFLCRVVCKNRSWILLLPILFTVFSYTQGDMLFVQVAYSSGVVNTFLSCLLFYMAFRTDRFSIKDKRWVCAFYLYLFYSIIFGGTGAVQRFLLPIIGAVILRFVIKNANSCVKELRINKTFAIAVTVMCIFAGVGLYINRMIMDYQHIGGISFAFSRSQQGFSDNITQLFQGYLYIIGIQPSAVLLSFDGMCNLIRLVVLTSACVVFPILAFIDYKNGSKSVQFLLLYTAIHVSEVLIVLIFCGAADYSANARYQLTSIALLFVVSANYVYEHCIRNGRLISMIYAAAVAAFSISLMLPIWKDTNYRQQYSDMHSFVNFLHENDLSYGYASFWVAGNQTILSNGAVQINNVNLYPNQVEKALWLSSSEWYDPTYYQGRTFLALTPEEASYFAPDGFEATYLGAPQKVLDHNGTKVLVFDHNISIHDFNGLMDGKHDFNARMSCVGDNMRQEAGEILITKGQHLYGPYIDLPEGDYVLTINAVCEKPTELYLNAGYSAENIQTYALKTGENRYSFHLDERKQDVEFIVSFTTDNLVEIDSIYLEAL